MHVHRGRRRAQQMIVQRCYLDAALDELLHNGVDFFVRKYEIAHHHAVAAPLLECKVGTQGKRRLDLHAVERDRKSTRLNSSHSQISYAVFCLKKKKDEAS